MTFLDRLIARATGNLQVLRTAPALAQELDHPAYGPPAEADADTDEGAVPIAPPAARRMPVRAATPEPAPEAVPVTVRTAASPAPPPRSETALSPRPGPATAKALITAEPKPTDKQPSRLPTRAPFDPPPRMIAPAATAPIPTDPPAPDTPRMVERLNDPTEPAAPRPAPPPQTQPAPRPDRHAARQDPNPPPQPEPIEIHLDIGRVDLVSAQPPEPRATTAGRHARPGPHLTLADYLDRRRGTR